MSATPEKQDPRQSKIFAAFALEIVEEPDAERKSDLMTLVTSLANYQEGVGQEPLHPLGLDIDVLNDVCDATSVETYATLVGSNKMRERQERYKQIRGLVDQERAMYMEMLSEVAPVVWTACSISYVAPRGDLTMRQ
jgi:hypothetical protein